MDMTSVFLHRSSDFVVGLDLGQSSDPSALAVIERVRGVLDSGSEFRAPHRLERAKTETR